MITWLLQRLKRVLLAAAAVCLLATASYFVGVRQGKAECQASTNGQALQVTVAGAKQARAQTASDLKRAGDTGAARERQRTAIDTHFAKLDQEAADEDHRSAMPACGLSADGLRRWAAANAGPGGDDAGEGAAPGQPADAAAEAATATLWPAAGPGIKPPRGGPPLSPGGQPAVRAADLPAGPARGLPDRPAHPEAQEP